MKTLQLLGLLASVLLLASVSADGCGTDAQCCTPIDQHDVPHNKIRHVAITDHNCRPRVIIVTAVNGRKYCMDPTLKRAQKLLEDFQNATRTWKQPEQTTEKTAASQDSQQAVLSLASVSAEPINLSLMTNECCTAVVRHVVPHNKIRHVAMEHHSCRPRAIIVTTVSGRTFRMDPTWNRAQKQLEDFQNTTLTWKQPEQ